MLPGGKWHVHDGDRPRPPVITPGTCSTEQGPGRAPSDAIVLFDGKDLSHWRGRRGRPADWKVEDGAMVIKPGAGEITLQGRVRRLPAPSRVRRARARPRARPGRGNSGLMFFGRYEIQVLDSFENVTYADGQAAAIYGQFPPLVNASRPPGSMAGLRHHFYFAPIQGGWITRITGLCHDAAQRRARAQPSRGDRRDGVSGRGQVHAARAQGADPVAGPRQPGAVSEYLGQGD